MNTQEIINSGKLECYVLGALSEQESQELDNLIQQQEEVKQEYNNIQKALNRYVMAFEKTPPLHLKKIALQDLSTTKSEVKGKQEKLRETGFKGKSKVVSIVLAVFLVLALGNSLYLYLNHISLKEEFEALNKKHMDLKSLTMVQKSLERELMNTKAHVAQLKEKLQVIDDTLSIKVVLSSTAFDNESSAIVFWNPNNFKTYLEVNDLTDPGIGMKYRLWAVRDNMMQDAGIIDSISSEAFYRMSDIENAEAFIITLEAANPSEDSEQPKIILEGRISPPSNRTGISN